MTREMKDHLAWLRFERDKFKSMSTQRRKDAAVLRKQRRFLDVIKALDRMHEYAQSARRRQAEIDKLKAMYA